MELTLLVQTQGALDALSRLDDGALEANDGRIVHELSTVAQRTDGAQEREEDEEQQQRLRLVQGNAGLKVELRQGSLPC